MNLQQRETNDEEVLKGDLKGNTTGLSVSHERLAARRRFHVTIKGISRRLFNKKALFRIKS